MSLLCDAPVNEQWDINAAMPYKAFLSTCQFVKAGIYLP